MNALTFPPIVVSSNGIWRRTELGPVPPDTDRIMLSSCGYQLQMDISGHMLNKQPVYIDICVPKNTSSKVSVMIFQSSGGMQMNHRDTFPLEKYKLYKLVTTLLHGPNSL